MNATIQASHVSDPLSFDASLDVEEVEGRMLVLPQVDVPLTHRFAPGVYMREVVMPAGSFVIRTKHFNVVTKGRALVRMDDKVEEIIAPCVFVSEAGVRKILLIVEEMTWATVHPTTETDQAKLDELLIEKSETFLDHEAALAAIEQLKLAAGEPN